MALALTLQQGEGFYIGPNRYYVEDFDDKGVWLSGPNDTRHRITEAESVEIEPEVFVSEGFVPEMGCRVLVDAPRKIAILRDELYQRADKERQYAGHDNPGAKR